MKIGDTKRHLLFAASATPRGKERNGGDTRNNVSILVTGSYINHKLQ